MAIRKSIMLVAVGFLFTGLAQAQQSTNAGGGDATGSGGTIAFSIGQVVFTSNTSGAGSVAQGVQHAFEIYTVGIKNTALNISLIAYPNPVTINLTLQISDYSDEKLTYQLHDMHGKLLSEGQIISQQTQINMYSLAAASYFLTVLSDGQKVKTFQVIKNK